MTAHYDLTRKSEHILAPRKLIYAQEVELRMIFLVKSQSATLEQSG